MKNKKVPKLRFPEFDGEWENRQIKNILKIKHGKDQKKVVSEDGVYPILGTGGQIGKTNHFIYDKESVLIGRKGTIDKPRYMNSPFWTVDTLFYSHIFDSNIPKFVYYLFETINWKELDESTGVPSLSASTIENSKIVIPNYFEQAKIAEFFTVIDQKIEIQKQIISKLETIKKGYLQRIFSQEIRFKDQDGNEFPEWEELNLGDLCSIKTGKLDANAMKPDGIYRFYTCAKEYYFIDRYAFDTEALLISGNGANVGYIHYYKGKFNAYQRTYVLDNFVININYCKYYLEKNLPERIDSEKKVGNTPYIVLGTLSEMTINYPIKEEQERIANFFSTFDQKIGIEIQKLEKWKQIKKGLLQQMFV